MKKLLFLCLPLLFSCSSETEQTSELSLVDLVNPLVGTDSEYALSNGNTYPAIALPWGMNFWTPQTNVMGNGWIYQYDADKLNGIRQTHQPSPWINDYGAFSVFPTTEKLVFDEKERASWYSHKVEVSQPHYYSAYLADYNTTVEVTPTERAACIRITYPETNEAYLVVDAFFKNSGVKVIPAEQKIIGYACNNSGSVPENFSNYFVIHIDKAFEQVFSVDKGEIYPDRTEVESEHAGCIIRFKTAVNEEVNLKIASSFISHAQAELNLKREIGSKSFDHVKQEGKDIWNAHLNRILVEGSTEENQKTFYTALYRTMLFPRKFFEYDEEGKLVHYSPYNGKVEEGYMFTDNGFWDTFRAVFPFFNIMFRELNSQIMAGLVNTYQESGWLPEWASPGHRNCMIGSNSSSIISDAYLKGIDIKDIEILYEAIVKNSQNEGPVHSVGRYGEGYYNELGYIPYNAGINENTARTLEYAYADYAISQLAEALNRPGEEIKLFKDRSMNYVNVFDSTVNFMRGKNLDGSFQAPFRADKWGDAFTEGCSWHWTWCVFHDVQGLIDLMGGNEKFVEKLDSVFLAAPTFDDSYYGVQIHEITEMLIANMGQYAHGNQPIQHMPYLYNYAGQPWKTQFHVRNIMEKLYNPYPDGLCGDEDNGQTSAWYVFSALGMYPVTPGSDHYALGSPLFNKASMQLENGNTFIIKARNNGPGKVYIRDADLNGGPYYHNYLNYKEILKGGVLSLSMSDKANTHRGTSQEAAPFSVTLSAK